MHRAKRQARIGGSRQFAVRLSTCLILMFGSMARAQPAPAIPAVGSALVPQTIDEGLRRQAERDRAQQEAATPHPDTLRPPDGRLVVLPELPDERPCFVITEIALLGADATRFRWLGDSTIALLNRCIGAQGLSRIAGYLDAQLIEQGYVTSRVSVGAQNLASGRVEFRLHTGRIESVHMLDADRPRADGGGDDQSEDSRWGTWRNAFPTGAGALLNIRDLEQGVEQMKRLPSQSVTTTLTPGAQPDTSVLTIERHAGDLGERVRGNLTLDNSGTPAFGRAQAAGNVALDNPLGINDLVSLSLNSNAEQPSSDHRSQGASLQYSVPFGYSTVSANVGHSRFAQIVQLPTLPHVSRGDSDTAEFKIDHIALRTSSAKTGLYASVSTRKSRSFLDDTELLLQRRQTTFFEVGVTFRKLLANNASIDAALGYRRGVSWLAAEDDLPTDPLDPAAVPTLRPRIWTYDVNVAIPFELPALAGDGPARPWQYSVAIKGQSTSDHTLTVDQIAIGNRATVRGFDGDSVLLAESGWYLRNEVSTPWSLASAEGAIYAGLDYGRVWGPSDILLLGHELAGMALGWRGRVQALQFDFALAKPIVKPDGFLTHKTSLYVSGAYVF